MMSRFLSAAAFSAVLALTLPGIASAHDYTLGALSIGHPWTRASAGHASNGAAFLTITSKAGADRLLAAQTPVADRSELHTHRMEEGVMKMRQVEAIDLPEGKTVELKPGGLHVMLFGLKSPLKEKEKVPLTLTFEKAGTITVELAVESLTAPPAAQPHSPDAHKSH